jgi:hypothetical protein
MSEHAWYKVKYSKYKSKKHYEMGDLTVDMFFGCLDTIFTLKMYLEFSFSIDGCA